MLYLYDIALKAHIKKVYSKIYLAERTTIFKKIRNTADVGDNSLTLPLIGMWRTDTSYDNSEAHSNMPELKHGRWSYPAGSDLSGPGSTIKAIGLPLTYQFDILAGNLKDADDMLSDLMFYLKDKPTVTFVNDAITFDFNVYIEDLSVTTDFGSFEEMGDIYGYALTAKVPEARLYHLADRKPMIDKIVIELWDGVEGFGIITSEVDNSE